MSINDITVLEQASMTGRGARLYNVGAGATTINPGEPVMYGSGGMVTVQVAGNNFPIVGSDYFIGIAATTSTQTTGTAGTIGVYPCDPLVTYLIRPKVASSWDTQAKYDALVGKSVLIDKTSGVFTLLATGAATNGVTVLAMNINEHPGQVAIGAKTGAIQI